MEWRLNDDGTWTRINTLEELQERVASAQVMAAASRARIAAAKALADRVRAELRRQRAWYAQRLQTSRPH